MGEPGFWDDPDAAARVNAEYARAHAPPDDLPSLERDADDLDGLVELAEEDPELAAEVEDALARSRRAWRSSRSERLFSGRYDAGDALVTVNAGAGGTDAQDWAEMLLRMEMRWAERRGFKVELLEASPGRRPASSRRRSGSRGENAYGLYGAEKGVHRLVRISPFDAADRRQTASPASRSRRCSRTRATSRSATRTCRSTPTAPRAPAASTSTRPTRRCASPTGRPASSCSARTSARSRRTS